MAKMKYELHVQMHIIFNVKVPDGRRPPSWFYVINDRARKTITDLLHKQDIPTYGMRFGTNDRDEGWVDVELKNRRDAVKATGLLLDDDAGLNITINKITVTHTATPE